MMDRSIPEPFEKKLDTMPPAEAVKVVADQ